MLLAGLVGSGCVSLLGYEEGELAAAGAGGTAGTGDPLSPPAGSAGTAASAPGVDADDLCGLYCEAVTRLCTDDNRVYQGGVAQCRQMCPYYEDQLACRYAQIQAAEGRGNDVREECAAAGPGGVSATGPECGPSLCDNYCQLMRAQCPEVGLGAEPNDGAPTADDDEFCLAVCDSVGLLGGSDVYLAPSEDDPFGNNLQCRIFHIGNAAQDAAEPVPDVRGVAMHCEHAAGRMAFCRIEDD